jgi:transglutaminase-like putative cysteine protease
VIGLGWSFWVTSRLLPARYTWPERWENLTFRLNYWYNQAVQGGTSYDNLMFILQMSVIVWLMGYLTIWLIFRSGKVWQGVVPGGLVLLINLYYAPKDITLWFILYLMVSLLLIIRFNLLNQETKWRAEGVFFHPDISFDFLRDGFIFSVLVVALAWLAPPVVDVKSLEILEEFQGAWRDFQDEWNRLYADLNYRDTQTFGTFGQSLTLGGPRYLTDEPVMDVGVNGTGRYWRATVYDQYLGSGWRSTDAQTASFGPKVSLSLPTFDARQVVTQTYTFYRDGSTVLYALSNPIRLDRSAKVYFNALSDRQIAQTTRPDWSGRGPWVEEITYLRSNATVDSSESYQVVSAVSQATVSELESAGTDYPPWITERYLQLPDTITRRTHRLARELTEPFDNPFDKTRAIEHYLRTELTYNERIPAPPPDVEKVDYILFTAKEAYCDYYASAMIVMLRSVGVPARLAAGFAQGSYNSELGLFHVINADAHSWVEVYFPRYGWIEFEPTAAQPAIVRPTAPEYDSPPGPGSSPFDDFPGPDERPDRQQNLPIDDENIAGLSFTIGLPWFGEISLPRSVVSARVIGLGLVMLAVLVGTGLWWRQQLSQPTGDITNLYQRMVRLAGWMGVARRPWQTPYEHAAVLQHNLPSRRREVETITGEYVHHIFSPPADASNRIAAQLSDARESNLAWNRLRSEMLKASLKRRLPRWLQGRR